MQGAQLMEDNQRLKQVSGREFPFFFFLFFGFPTFSIDGKCQFQQMENQLMIKTHLCQSPIFAAQLILLNTKTTTILLSSWGKFNCNIYNTNFVFLLFWL